MNAGDDEPGSAAVVVIGEEVWRQGFGGDPGVIGRLVRIDDRVHEVVGVMPRRFTWGVFRAWLPMRADLYRDAIAAEVQITGWLRDGVSATQAAAQVLGVFRDLAARSRDRYPAEFDIGFHHPAVPAVRDDLRQTVWMLLAAVALLQCGKGSSRTTGFGGVWRALIGLEAGMAMTLLVLTAVCGRSLLALESEPLHYSPDGIVLLSVMLPESRYATHAAGAGFVQRVLERYRGMAGVESASVAFPGGPRGSAASRFSVLGRPAAETDRLNLHIVGADFFDVYRVPLLVGRAIDRADEASGRPVAVVNEAFVQRYLGGESPLGRQIRVDSLRGMTGATGPSLEIVGVSANVPTVPVGQLESRIQPEVAVPFSAAAYGRHRYFVVHTAERNPLSMVKPLQQALWTLDPDQAFRWIRTEDETLWILRYGWPEFRALVLALFGGLSLALVAAGTYGILSYVTSQSARDIGVRLALGARTGDVLRQVVQSGLTPSLIGLCAGAAVAAALGVVMRSMVANVSPWDPLAYTCATGTFLVVIGCATYLPGRRASRIDPAVTMRSE